MAAKLNYGKKFSNSSTTELTLTPRIRAKVKSDWAPGGKAWWTQDRKAKLKKCMDMGEDARAGIDKACRVFPNVTRSMIEAQWNRMETLFRSMEDNYEDWCSQYDGSPSIETDSHPEA